MEQAQTELSWRERGRLWLRLGIRFLLIAAVVLGLRYLAPPLLSLFMPFVLALLLAWLLNPLVRTLQKALGPVSYTHLLHSRLTRQNTTVRTNRTLDVRFIRSSFPEKRL